MIKTSTRKFPFFPAFCLLWILQLVLSQDSYGQQTPSFTVNLDGKPAGVWTSGPVNRKGLVCNITDQNYQCAKFVITLDPRAGGLQFDIVDGPIPSGAMFYQVNCGANIPVGQPICVNGTGPHTLTICMPGNAVNGFKITSVPAFNPVPDMTLTAGCFATLNAPTAFEPSTVNWQDISYGGTYNSYLSSTSGTSNPTIRPGANPPAYVDYKVCGTSVASKCATLPFCDTVRVYFNPVPTISINPNPAIICPGSPGVELTGTVTGTNVPYSYYWTDSNGNLVATSQKFMATVAGTYQLEVRNNNYPNCTPFTKTIEVVTNLTVNAGADQLVCSLNSVQLSGTVTAATGGIWSGGAGSFSPSNTALNAVYTPTAAEIQAGSVRLTLTSTGNGSCAPVQDQVLINFYQVNVALTGTAVVCPGATGSITATVTGAQSPVTYRWSTGETTASISNKPAGTYSVTVTDGMGCSVARSFTITQGTSPSDLAASLQPSTCGNSNGVLTISAVTGGTAPYTYSRDGVNFQSSASFANLLAGTYTITVKDVNGCSFAKSFTLGNIAGPAALTAAAQAATCANNDGRITSATVTGGTAPYTYSINGSSFQTGTLFSGLPAGGYTVTAKDANGCMVSTFVTVDLKVPVSFTSTTASSTCGSNNGSLTVTSVTGGDAPYTYSKDGVTFQSSASFTGLLAGTYYITVQDANGCKYATPVTVGNITGATDLTAAVQSATCGASNGKITVSAVTGGQAPYSYSLDGQTYQQEAAFANLAAGEHRVYVQDARGCVYLEEVILNNINGPAFTAAASASSCGANNGSIAVSSITGGTAPYSYSLDAGSFQASGTFANLAAGDYTLTVKDANGCISSRLVTLSDIAGATDFAASTVSSSCGRSNGSMAITGVTGGTAPYTYALNEGAFGSGTTFSNLVAGTYTISVKDARGCIYTREVIISDIPGPSGLAPSVQSSTCGNSNGVLSISAVTGGAAPFTYSRNNGAFQASATFVNLPAGIHLITVKDANGCTYAESFTISNLVGPTAVAATALPASCVNNDGRITAATVTGGTAPYTYSINGSSFQTGTVFSGLPAGGYTLTAKDANGCMVSTFVTVERNVPSSFTSTTAASSCGSSNGSLTITGVTGGTAPYEYSNNGAEFQSSATFAGLLSGTYSITVKDAKGCSFTGQVTVTNNGGATGLTASVKAATCGESNGGITVGSVTGGLAPYSYSLDGQTYQQEAAFTNLSAGEHQVYVKDARGCVYLEAVILNNIAGPTFTAAASSSTCGANNGSIAVSSITGGTAPYSYSLDAGSFQASGTFANLAAGDYTLTVKDSNGCTFSQSLTLTDIAGATDFAASTFSSSCGRSNGSVTITGVTGGTAPYVYSKDRVNFQASANLFSFPAGEHTIWVKDANGCIFGKTITINDIAGPSGVAASATASTCGNANGELAVTGVTGGTAPYAYSLNQVTYQSAAIFTGLAAGQHSITVKDANGCTFTSIFTLSNIAGPSAVTATALAASCANNNGSIALGSVTGGTAPYTYALNGGVFQESPSFSGLAAGTYTFRVRDANGCEVSTPVTVDKNVPASFTSTTVASTCGSSNGSLTVTSVTGGTSPYEYSKNGEDFTAAATFTGLAAGQHTIWVQDANGCTYSAQVTVSDNGGATDLTVTVQAPTCSSSNGQITISSVAGGQAPYAYSLDGISYQSGATFSSLEAKAYLVYVKDAKGCVYVEEVPLNNTPGPSFNAVSRASSCGGPNGSLTVSEITSGTAPFTFALDGGAYGTSATFSGLLAGSYTITVKDANGCTFSRSMEVGNTGGATAITATTIPATCDGRNGSITIAGVTGGVAPYTYALNGGAFQASATFSQLGAQTYVITVKDALNCTYTQQLSLENIAGPAELAVELQPSTCGNANGMLTISSVTGGTAPYTYSLDGINYQSQAAFLVLAAGTHTVTVKDANGCTFAKTFTLTNIAGPDGLTATAAPATCANNDGSITVSTISGGTAPYTYAVEGGDFQLGTLFPGLAAGSHMLTARDANGCLISIYVTVGKNVPTSFTSTAVPSTCGSDNGSLTITGVTGGTGPYVFSKNGTDFQPSATFTGLLAGTYSITVKDANGCAFTGQVTVTDNGGATDLVAAVKSPTCGNSNGEITVNGLTGGQAPYTYSLDGVSYQAPATFIGLEAKAYLVYVKDARGCVYQEEVLLNNIAGPMFTAIAQASTCGGSNGEIRIGTVTGGTAPYTYSLNGGAYGASTTFTGLLAGNHTITIRDANGCVFSQWLDVEDITGATDLNVFVVASSCGRSNGQISITGVTGGAAPYAYALDGGSFQPEAAFASLVAGEHTIRVQDANGCIFAKKVVVDNVEGPVDFTATTQSSTCGAANGSLTVSGVTGGTAPYSYSKDGITFQPLATLTNLLAGQHTIRVQDANGCIVTRLFVVNNIAGPGAVAATSQPATCADNDGSITAGVVTGGTAPYTYALNDGKFQSGLVFSSLASGTYTLTGKDANGCTVSARVTVDKNVPVGITSTTVAATCGAANGSLTLTGVMGGTGPYTYSKDGTAFQASATFNGLLPGEHTIWVKDANGCTYASQVVVPNNGGATDLVAAVKSPTCGDSNGEITISSLTGGQAPYTYSLDGVSYQGPATFSSLEAKAYLVYVKDARGCVYQEEVLLNNIAGPMFTAIAQASTCGGSNGEIRIGTVTGGTAPYTYALEGSAYGPSATFAGLLAGTYTIRVKDANGCFYAREIVVEDIAGATDLAATTQPTSCGRSNGQVSITGVTGGTAPYAYALDGGAYQAGTSFPTLMAGGHTVYVKDANGCIFTKKIVVENIDGPADLTAGTEASTCGASDGSLTVTGVTGGTAPYSYSLDGVAFQPSATFTGLAAGQYTVRVQDANGCNVARSFVVNNIAGPGAVAATSQPATCADNDGSITVSMIQGGSAPYTYALNGNSFQAATTFSGLASGTYTLLVKDAKGCIASARVTVDKNVPVGITSTTVAAICGAANGSLTLTGVMGGTGPYTYSKDGTAFQASATFSGLLPGEQAIWVKDANGCTFTGQVVVSNSGGATDLAASVKAVTCGERNGEITISSLTGGTAPYTYSLDGTTFQASATFGNLAAGAYQVYVKDAQGCLYQEEVLLNNIAGPVFTAVAKASTCGSRNGEVAVTVTGGTAPFGYSLDGVTFQSGATFTGLVADTYTIRVQDANGCFYAGTIQVEDVAGPQDLAAATGASNCGSSNGQITITGVTGGTAPYTYALNGGAYQPGTSFLAVMAGEYTITVRDANGCTIDKKVVVKNIDGPADFTASTRNAICGAANGSLTVTGVTGGTAPYSYSSDGTTFQAPATFANLMPGAHRITVQDANGCTYTKTVTVGNIAGPEAVAATSQAATCAGNNGRIVVGAVTGGTAPFTYSVNDMTLQEATTFSGLTSGTYTLRVKDANGCQLSTAVTVEQHVPADFASSTLPATCGENNGSLTITGVTGGTGPYSYSLDGVAFQASAAFSGLAAGPYTVTVQDANGCTFAGKVAVASSGGATGLTASVKTPTCGGNNGEISVTNVMGGTAPYSYSLDGTSYQTGSLFRQLGAGIYQVHVKDARGCVYQEEVLLNNIPGPSFTARAIAASCGGSNGSLTVTEVTGGTAPFSYSKDGISFQAYTTFSDLAAGIYTISVKDVNGCLYSRTLTVEDSGGATDFTATTVAASCGGNNGSITISGVVGGTAPYTYSLDGGTFQSSVTFSQLAGRTHTVTIKDASGCVYVREVVVEDLAAVSDIATSATPSYCSANTGSITIDGVTGGTAPYEYSLDGASYQGYTTFTGLAPAHYKVYVKDAKGCISFFTVSVLSQGPQAADLSARPADCGQANGAITINQVTGGTGGLTYSLNGSPFQAANTFSNLAAGTYEVTILDAQGCTLVVTQNVVNSGATHTFTLAETSASCGNKNGRVVVSQVSGGSSPYVYSIDGKNFQASPEFAGLAEGTYQVSVKDALGCINIKTATIGSIPPLAGLKVAVEPAGCSQAAGQVIIEDLIGGVGPYAFSLDGVNFTDSRLLTGVVPGSYVLTVKDATGCRLTQVVRVERMGSQVASVRQVSCHGGTDGLIVLTSMGDGPGTEYSIDNGLTFQSDSVFSNLPKGLYQVLVRFPGSCTLTLSGIEVKAPEPIVAQIAVLAKALGQTPGSAAITAISGGQRPYSYQVDNGAFVTDTLFSNLSSGEHSLVVKDKNGCTATVAFTIEGISEIEIPNGFTPNGDGLNDVWVLRNLSVIYPKCRVTVFNRWGVEVFRSVGYKQEWDGNYNGKPLPDGTYYCIIELGDGKAPLRKSVTIMR